MLELKLQLRSLLAPEMMFFFYQIFNIIFKMYFRSVTKDLGLCSGQWFMHSKELGHIRVKRALDLEFSDPPPSLLLIVEGEEDFYNSFILKQEEERLSHL